jgi:hypothetical protein
LEPHRKEAVTLALLLKDVVTASVIQNEAHLGYGYVKRTEVRDCDTHLKVIVGSDNPFGIHFDAHPIAPKRSKGIHTAEYRANDTGDCTRNGNPKNGITI